MTVFSDERQFIERVISVPKLVSQQREALTATLQEVIKTLDEAEMKHREKFRDEKLTDCFPPTLGYFFSKIFEAIHSPRYFPLGRMHIDLVSECLAKMKALLEQRGEWGIYDSVNYEYELLEYPISQLQLFFSDPTSSKLSDKDAYIFTSFVQNQFKSLQAIAEEFDEQYASLPARDA